MSGTPTPSTVAGQAEDAEARLHDAAQGERQPWWSLQHRGRIALNIHLVLVGLFIVLALLIHALPTDHLDLMVTRFVQDHGTALDGPLRGITWIGYDPQFLVLSGVLIGAVAVLGYWYAAAFLFGSLLGASMLDWVAKMLVARPRPAGSTIHVLHHLTSYSFPSGHVVSYVALFGALASFALIELRHAAVRWCVALPPIVLVILVGPSRIYVGEHWATDVLGAYLLGGVWLSLVLRVYVAWRGRPPRPRPPMGVEQPGIGRAPVVPLSTGSPDHQGSLLHRSGRKYGHGQVIWL